MAKKSTHRSSSHSKPSHSTHKSSSKSSSHKSGSNTTHRVGGGSLIPKFNLGVANKLVPKKDVIGVKGQYIKGVNNNVVYIVGGLIIAGLYYGTTKGQLPFSFPFGGTADQVSNLMASPALVRPGDPVTVTGVFVDGNGNSVSVPQSYIQVVEDIGAVKLNESLGVNVNRFSKTINTLGFRAGAYTVTVSDRPITAAMTPTSEVPPADIVNTGGGEGFGLAIA